MVAFLYSKENAKKTSIFVPELSQSEEVEVLLEESWQWTNATTDNPVEEGADITDHVDTKPLIYTISGVFTDAPVFDVNIDNRDIPEFPITGLRQFGANIADTLTLGFAGAGNQLQSDLAKYIRDYTQTLSDATSLNIDRLPNILEFYKNLIVGKYLVSIDTREEYLENMLCMNYTHRRDKSTGRALYVEAQFKQIRIVPTDTVEIEEKEDEKISSANAESGITAKESKKGKKTPEPASENGSILYNSLLGG